MPSRISSLLATWLYSDIASTPSVSASLRMLSDPTPALVGEVDGGDAAPAPWLSGTRACDPLLPSQLGSHRPLLAAGSDAPRSRPRRP